jgi:hypothetical protein
MRKYVVGFEILAGIGLLYSLKFAATHLTHLTKHIYHSIKGKTEYTIHDSKSPKAECVAIIGNNAYAYNYALYLHRDINVLMICNDQAFMEESKKKIKEINKDSAFELKCKLITKDADTIKDIEEYLSKMHVKTLISCIEADNYAIEGKFHSLSEEIVADIQNKYINIPFFLAFPIFKSMAEGTIGAFIRVTEGKHNFKSVGNGILDELWAQFESKGFCHQKVMMGKNVEKTVLKSIATIGCN